MTKERTTTFTGSPSYYPAAVIRSGKVEFLGDDPKLTIYANPIQYRHVTESIRSFKRMLVEITFTGTPVPREDHITTPDELLAYSVGAEGMKIRIERDGIYRITYADWLASGLDLSFDPRNLKLFRQGTEVPTVVEGDTDGSFDPGDSVTFFGTGYKDLYTDTETYYLLPGDSAGIRMVTMDATPLTVTVHESTPATETQREYKYFNNINPGISMDDRWRGPAVMTIPGKDMHNCTFDLPYAAASGTATVSIRVHPSMASPSIDPDHHLRVYVNDTEIGDFYCDGKDYHTGTIEFDAGLLESLIPNTVTVQCVKDMGLAFDLIYMLGITLDYPRTWESDGARLIAQTQIAGIHTATSFSLGEPLALDVTDTDNPVILTGGIFESGDYTFETGDSNRYAFTSEPISPDWVVNEPSSIRAIDNGCDYVIITHSHFTNAAETLALHRSDYDGYTVMAVDVENIYDEYAGGRKGVDAIRSFILDISDRWDTGPQAVLLFGDASGDTHGYYSGTDRNFVPTVFRHTGTGYTMSDHRLAISNDAEQLPVTAIGRLPVTTAYEAERMVDKIIAYDLDVAGPWCDRIVLAADKPDPGTTVSDYHLASDTFSEHIPLSYTVEKAYFTGSSASKMSTRTAILNAFTDGALILNYSGHGGYDIWSDKELLKMADVSALPAQPGQPFVIVSNCLSGAIDYPTFRTLSEALLSHETGGAIGVFGSGSATGSSGQFFLNASVYQSVFYGNDLRFGMITKNALELAAGMFVPSEDLDSFNLFADPMQRMKK